MKRALPVGILSVLILFMQYNRVVAQNRTAESLLEQQKIRFFNENLQLTATESARFWPIYNDYQNRRDKITADRNNLISYFQANSANMTAAEANDAINRFIQYQQQETELLVTFTTRFRTFLPPNKVMRIYIVENEFKKWLLENLRENRAQTAPRN